MKWLEISSDDCGWHNRRFWIVEVGAAQCISTWLFVALCVAWWRFRSYRSKQNTHIDGRIYPPKGAS